MARAEARAGTGLLRWCPGEAGVKAAVWSSVRSRFIALDMVLVDARQGGEHMRKGGAAGAAITAFLMASSAWGAAAPEPCKYLAKRPGRG
jgi:hypothetical protein